MNVQKLRVRNVGIIATEKGWNLYVCGNGGMKPRHADLLAADIDRETLIKYLDRFMMSTSVLPTN